MSYSMFPYWQRMDGLGKPLKEKQIGGWRRTGRGSPR
jgi:hypothetical protein